MPLHDHKKPSYESKSIRPFETSFASCQHGFLLTSLTVGEDGNFEPDNLLIYTYTYQTVDGVELPDPVAVIRESHHEVRRFTLSGCTVKTTNESIIADQTSLRRAVF